MLTDFRYEFYNAGNRIDENMRFSISPSSAGYNPESNDVHSVGFWHLDAPKESFFTVPADIPSGNEVMRVNFADDIKRRFGKQGVVLIDAKWDAAKEDPEEELSKYPVAPNRDAAIVRGEAIWQLYLRRIVEGHLADCQNAMAAGGAPRAASGFTKKAFKLLNIADPGEQYFAGLKEAGKSAGNSNRDELLASVQQQQTALMGVVLAIAAGQKFDPELLKSLLPKMGPTTGAGPIASGIATGEIKKPVGEFDPKRAGLDGAVLEAKPGQVSTDAYDRKMPHGKKDRTAEAAKELTTK